MKTITKHYTVFDYKELTDRSKEKAFCNWNASQTEWFWMDENINSMKDFAKFFDVNIKDYGIGGQHNHVSFSLSDEVEQMEYVRLWKYIKNHNYEVIKNHIEKSEYTIDPMKTTIFDCCPFTGYCMDESLLDEMRTFLERPYNITFYELIEKCFDSFIKSCTSDMEYQQSEECFVENYATDNNYLEDGSIFNE